MCRSSVKRHKYPSTNSYTTHISSRPQPLAVRQESANRSCGVFESSGGTTYIPTSPALSISGKPFIINKQRKTQTSSRTHYHRHLRLRSRNTQAESERPTSVTAEANRGSQHCELGETLQCFGRRRGTSSIVQWAVKSC